MFTWYPLLSGAMNKIWLKIQPIRSICQYQGSGNFEIWISPADDDDVINEPISKKKKICVYHLSQKLITIGSPITTFK